MTTIGATTVDLGVMLRHALRSVPATARAMRWTPLTVAVPLALLVMWTLGHVVQHPVELVRPVRLSALLLASAAAWVLDDPSATTLDTLPLPRSVRRSTRIALVAVAVLTAWAGSVAFGVAVLAPPLSPAPTDLNLPITGLLVELAALTLLGLLVAASVANRPGETRAGLIGSIAILTLPLALAATSTAPALLAGPADPTWTATRTRWLGLLLTVVVATTVANRDPSARAIIRRAWQGPGRRDR